MPLIPMNDAFEEQRKNPLNIFHYLISRMKHKIIIRGLNKKYSNISKQPSTLFRTFVVLFLALLSIVFYFSVIDPDLFSLSMLPLDFSKVLSGAATDNKSLVSLFQLLVIAPILLGIWFFRDHNRLRELALKRKDTNLKEFQQLQQWATGNIDDSYPPEARVALQISALHTLRGYLKGEYGEEFKRGAYEIFCSVLSSVHKGLLEKVASSIPRQDAILKVVNTDELTKQVNRIASEEWFNLIVNHDFPTGGMSLVGVDLTGCYLRHRNYDKNLDLKGADLRGAEFDNAFLQGVMLNKAIVDGASFYNAQLQGSRGHYAFFRKANLSGTYLDGTEFIGANFNGSGFGTSSFKGANLGGASFKGAGLASVDLRGACLIGTNFQGSKLTSSRLQGVCANEALFQYADLSGVKLQGAYLNKAKFEGAITDSIELAGCCTKFRQSSISYENLISEQIGLDSELDELDSKPLTQEENSELEDELKETLSEQQMSEFAIRSRGVVAAISLNESKSLTYSKKDAKEWILEIYNSIKEVQIKKRFVNKRIDIALDKYPKKY